MKWSALNAASDEFAIITKYARHLTPTLCGEAHGCKADLMEGKEIFKE